MVCASAVVARELGASGLAGAEVGASGSAVGVVLDLVEKGKNKKQEKLTSEQVLVVGPKKTMKTNLIFFFLPFGGM